MRFSDNFFIKLSDTSVYVIKNINIEDEVYNDELKSQYRGKVVKKYIDENEHNQPFLVLKNDSVMPVFYKYFESIEIGDSISKEKKSNFFRIYKSKSHKIISYDIRDEFLNNK